MSDLTASQIDLVKVHIRLMVRAILNQVTVADLEQILTDRFYDFRINSIPKEAVRELMLKFVDKNKRYTRAEIHFELNKLLEGDNNGDN